MSGGAYTRSTGKKVLVPRRQSVPYRDSWGGVSDSRIATLVAVPASRVLRELPCDGCRREIERGELCLRERRGDYFVTTCDICAGWILAEDLL